MAAGGRERLGHQRLAARAAELGVVAEHRDRLGRAQQQVGGVAARGQHACQPLRRERLVAQQPQVPVRRAERVADPAEREQPGVRVGGAGEPAEHHRQQRALDRGPPGDAGGERLEVAQRAGRVAVAERLEPRRAASGVSRASPASSRATALSSGR